jgi:hypothetical protein
MLEGFERFTQPGGRSFKPKVSIRKRGQIGFNLGAINRFELDKYEFAVLFMATDRNSIAVKFTNDPNEKGAVKLSKRKGNYFIAAKNFLDYYGVDYSQSTTYPAEWIDEAQAAIVTLNESEN